MERKKKIPPVAEEERRCHHCRMWMSWKRLWGCHCFLLAATLFTPQWHSLKEQILQICCVGILCTCSIHVYTFLSALNSIVVVIMETDNEKKKSFEPTVMLVMYSVVSCSFRKVTVMWFLHLQYSAMCISHNFTFCLVVAQNCLLLPLLRSLIDCVATVQWLWH